MIICNNCVGARCYQIFNKQYEHPFIWCRISCEDFEYLIEHIKELDFQNFQLVQHNDSILQRIVYGIKVDNKITIWYPHYIKDESYDIPAKSGDPNLSLDIHYKDIETYIIEKYTSRVKRFDNKSEDIIFIVNEDNAQDNMNYTFDNMYNIANKNRNNVYVSTKYIIKDGINHIYNMHGGSTMYVAKEMVKNFNFKL